MRFLILGIGMVAFVVLTIVNGIRKKGRCSTKIVGKITGVHESVGTDSEGSKDYSYSAEYEYVVDGKT